MGEFVFEITRISPGLCQRPACEQFARQTVRLLGALDPAYRVCGRHKRWAKQQALERQFGRRTPARGASSQEGEAG